MVWRAVNCRKRRGEGAHPPSFPRQGAVPFARFFYRHLFSATLSVSKNPNKTPTGMESRQRPSGFLRRGVVCCAMWMEINVIGACAFNANAGMRTTAVKPASEETQPGYKRPTAGLDDHRQGALGRRNSRATYLHTALLPRDGAAVLRPGGCARAFECPIEACDGTPPRLPGHRLGVSRARGPGRDSDSAHRQHSTLAETRLLHNASRAAAQSPTITQPRKGSRRLEDGAISG